MPAWVQIPLLSFFFCFGSKEWAVDICTWGCSSLGRAVGSQSAGTGIETLLLHVLLEATKQRQWCIGNIEASQALAPGSTPGWRMYIFLLHNKGGCSSNGRAPALHAGCTGIDTLLLHLLLFLFSPVVITNQYKGR